MRAEIDDANESLGKKIRDAKGQKIPYLLVVGDAEVKDKTITVESRDKGKLDAVDTQALLALLKKEIDSRS